MINRAFTNKILWGNIFPFTSLFFHEDEPLNKPPQKLLPGEIGFDKVKKIFHREDGHYTPELQSIISSTTGVAVGGFFIGGFNKSRLATESFIKENHATKFINKLDAQRQMQFRFLLEYFRGGMPLALRLGAFCFLFTSVSTCLNVYRGEFSILNSTFAGGLAGFIYKWNMGIKGVTAGTVFGSTVGCIYGCINSAMMYLCGIDIQEMHKDHADYMNKARDKTNIALQKYLDDNIEKKLFDQNKKVKELIIDAKVENS